MLLENAIIYGARGVAANFSVSDGNAETVKVNALDKKAAEKRASSVAETGGLDVFFNAISFGMF